MNSFFKKFIIIFMILYQFEYIKICNASKKYNRYLAHIFNKYGNGGALSFEGLEHLMFNLGLGGLEFNISHTIEEHHPDGYKIPDLVFEDEDDIFKNIDDNNHENRIYSNSKFNIEFKTNNNNPKMQNTEIENYEHQTATESNEINFKEMHDPKHRHPRHRDNIAASDNKCLSPKSLMKLVIDHDDLHRQHLDYKINLLQGQQHPITKRYAKTEESRKKDNKQHDEDDDYNEFISNVRITPETFLKICPALLVQIDQDACAQHIESDQINVQNYAYSWIYATTAVFIISCCGLFGIAIVPLIKSAAYNEILKFLVSVAIGTLCGDALMHLLPHALINEHQNVSDITIKTSSTNHHNNEPVWLCSCAFLIALFMYSLENLLPLLKGTNIHHHGHSQHHNHSPEQMIHMQQQQQTSNSTNIDMEISGRKTINLDPKEINVMLNEVKEDKKDINLSPVAFMVVLGDGLHNLTDGLAIGAAFAIDPVTGMATALAVLCHELPHELGDFALLLQTGLHIKRAIFLNIISSILSFMGMAIGLCVAGIHSNMVRWIYAGTAGSFLYIAFADLIPEISRNNEKSFKNFLIQISGILLGGIIMLLIALNEDPLRRLFE